MNDQDNEDLRRLAELLAQSDLASDDPYRRLAEALAPDEHYTHEQAEAELPEFVTDEYLGREVGTLYPALFRHLLHCQRCAALHVAMLADLEEEQPEVAIPRPDLSFLPAAPESPWQAIAGDVTEATRQATHWMLGREWPAALEHLEVVAEAFFAQVARLGEDWSLRSGAAAVMGFGPSEVSQAQRVLAAAYRANSELARQYGSGALRPDDLKAIQPQILDIAQRAAAEMGIARREQARFAGAYWAWLWSRLKGEDVAAM